MFFGSTTGVATHSLSNQAVMNFRDLRNIEAAFFIPACFALPYITRAGCCRALPVWKQAWHLNYQQCRLMCNLRHKAGTFLMYTRGWYASVLRFLMFWEKFLMSDVLAAYLMLTELLFFPPILYPFRMEIVRFIIFKFLSSISHSHVCLVMVPNWRALFPTLGIT